MLVGPKGLISVEKRTSESTVPRLSNYIYSKFELLTLMILLFMDKAEFFMNV